MYYKAFCSNCNTKNLFDIDDGNFFRIERKQNPGTSHMDGVDLCFSCWDLNMKERELLAYDENWCYNMCNCSLCHAQVANGDTGEMYAVGSMKEDGSGWKYAFCFSCYEKTIGFYGEKGQ